MDTLYNGNNNSSSSRWLRKGNRISSLYIILLALMVLNSECGIDNNNRELSKKRKDAVSVVNDNDIPSDRMYIFVNPRSGGRKAGDLLTLPNPYIYNNISVYRLNISDYNKDDKKLFKMFYKNITKNPSNVYTRILVAGGDGSVMGCVNRLREAGIDLTKITFGHIPYGTGNDFAKVTGWGTKPPSLPGHNNKTINRLITKFINAKIDYFDLWKVTFTVDKKLGSFWNVVGGSDNMLAKRGKPIRKLELSMMNYFSMGLESKIGREFERHRGTSQIGNKMRYAWDAIRQIGQECPTVKDYINTVTETSTKELIFHTEYCHTNTTTTDDDDDDDDEPIDDDDDKKMAANRLRRLRNKGKSEYKSICGLPQDRLLNDDAISLIMLNIPSFAASGDIWDRADHWWNRIAVNSRSKDQLNGTNRFSDGKLNMLTYKDTFSFYLDVALKLGTARRLYEGEGPFDIMFKPSTMNGKRYYTYMQVDGEYYKVYSPTKATVTFDYNIRVLVGGTE